MKPKLTKEKVEHILQKIAMDNCTSVDEVKREIKMAMVTGMCNQNPEVQKKWSEMPHEALLSTEEFIMYMAMQIE